VTTKGWTLYMGCVIPTRLPFIEVSIRETLRRFEVPIKELQEFTCCPNPLSLAHLDQQAALAIAARNLAVAQNHNVDIITPCCGCFETLKGAAAQLSTDEELREEINEILREIGFEYKGNVQVKHIVEFLYQDIGVAAIADAVKHPLRGLRVALHYGCHLLRPSNLLKVDDALHPTFLHNLVHAIGATPISYQDEMDCCGQGTRAGDRDLSFRMAGRKLSHIQEAGADGLVVTCPACFLNFDLFQRLALKSQPRQDPVPVFYYPELLCLAVGTPVERLGLAAHRVKVDSALERVTPRLALPAI
jgi:heterodisulfide reductase subunit B